VQAEVDGNAILAHWHIEQFEREPARELKLYMNIFYIFCTLLAYDLKS
jgi:hypothetical protein